MRTSRVVMLATVVGAFFTAEEVFMDLAQGHQVKSVGDIWSGLEFWLVWAALTPLVLVAVRRWPLDVRPVSRPVLTHLGVGVTLAVVHNLIQLAARTLVVYAQGHPFGDAFSHANPVAFVWGVFTGVLFYAVVVMVYTALRYRSSALALEGQFTRSQLDALRSQLRPHFLFNTLNAIYGLMAEDVERARQMLLRLSTLLRRSLDEEAHEVPLQQELAFLTDYLDIQRVRFGARLCVGLSIDPGVLEERVPVFLLQPLLENAIEHGASSDGCTRIAVAIDGDRDVVRIVVEDEGPGLARSAPLREGIGLRNTRERLRHLYGSRASVTLAAAHETPEAPGTRVEVRIRRGLTVASEVASRDGTPAAVGP